MKRVQEYLLLCGIWFAAGCVSSINPLYTKETSVRDAAIEGIWFLCDENPIDGSKRRESLSILPICDRNPPLKEDVVGYTIAVDTLRSSEAFDAKLVELGGRRFLDVYSLEDLANPNSIPVHNILLITVADDELTVAALDPSKLEQVIKAGEPHLSVARVGRRLVLTASTAELQAFLATHGEQVFGAERRYRKAPQPAGK